MEILDHTVDLLGSGPSSVGLTSPLNDSDTLQLLTVTGLDHLPPGVLNLIRISGGED